MNLGHEDTNIQSITIHKVHKLFTSIVSDNNVTYLSVFHKWVNTEDTIVVYSK